MTENQHENEALGERNRDKTSGLLFVTDFLGVLPSGDDVDS